MLLRGCLPSTDFFAVPFAAFNIRSDRRRLSVARPFSLAPFAAKIALYPPVPVMSFDPPWSFAPASKCLWYGKRFHSPDVTGRLSWFLCPSGYRTVTHPFLPPTQFLTLSRSIICVRVNIPEIAPRDASPHGLFALYCILTLELNEHARIIVSPTRRFACHQTPVRILSGMFQSSAVAAKLAILRLTGYFVVKELVLTVVKFTI